MRAPPLWVRNSVLLVVVVVPFLATIAAIVLLWNRLATWTDVALLVGMWTLSGIGVTVGYHRMLTHRGFTAPAPVRGVLLALGSMSLQGPAIEWASTHFVHHAKADREGDPHSPLEGLFHAHLGWLFRDRFVTEGPVVRAFAKDPVAVFVDRTFYVWAALGFAIPFAIAGWTGLLWGGLVRVFVGHHITWSVNSICHAFGRRPFATNDASRNNWFVALFSFGEGWHNNHHAHPQSADHGLAWWQFDPSSWLIRGMEKMRIARDVVRAPRITRKEARRRMPISTAPTALLAPGKGP